MKRSKLYSNLNQNQSEILEKFVNEFLPPTGTKRKYVGNELENIQKTMYRLFKIHFGFQVDFDDCLNCFKKLGYTIFIKPSNGRHRIIGQSNKFSTIYLEHSTTEIHIDVDAGIVRKLYKSTVTLPPHTNIEKIAQQKELQTKINYFVAKQIF